MKIHIIDDILAPSDKVVIRYKGPNPFAAFAMFPRLIRDVMKVTGKDTFETDVRWDSSEDPRGFYGMWYAKRTEDNWTFTRIRAIAQGAQSLKDKEGWLYLELKGTVETRHEYSNFVQRSFWWFYNRTFYYHQRRKYIDFAKDNIFQIRDRVLRTLQIERETRGEARSERAA